MQDNLEVRYVELTTRLLSVEAFCDFLAGGGVVRVAERRRSLYRGDDCDAHEAAV